MNKNLKATLAKLLTCALLLGLITVKVPVKPNGNSTTTPAGGTYTTMDEGMDYDFF